MNDNIDIQGIIDDLKDRLNYFKKETAEIDKKIDILKIAVKFKDGQITNEELRAELKKIVYRDLH